jgi:hypothetical protein
VYIFPSNPRAINRKLRPFNKLGYQTSVIKRSLFSEALTRKPLTPTQQIASATFVKKNISDIEAERRKKDGKLALGTQKQR